LETIARDMLKNTHIFVSTLLSIIWTVAASGKSSHLAISPLEIRLTLGKNLGFEHRKVVAAFVAGLNVRGDDKWPSVSVIRESGPHRF
jgi:hypothetical protein